MSLVRQTEKNINPITGEPISAVLSHAPWERGQVRCIDTGEIFESAAAAAHSIGCGRSAMSNHLSGRFPHIRGKRFERVAEAE